MSKDQSEKTDEFAGQVHPEDMTTDLERMISKDQFANINSFEAALALAEEVYGELIMSDTMGDGFRLLDNKMELVGKPFIILDTSLTESEKFKRNGKPGMFTTMKVVTQDDRKYVVVDGGAGICNQIQEWRAKTNRRGGFFARHGLNVSEYTYTDGDGNESPAQTFYLDESGV